MRGKNMTFGQVISNARKKANLSQKELAARVKKEDGQPISPQYLNDIERDRRSPSSDFLIEQFATILSIPPDVLYFQAGELPADIRSIEVDNERVVNGFKAFRKSLRGN
jgi:transcriptional regulator with XRE-family HTH domain